MGVIHKHKTVSGLIKYQPKGDPADWATAAKGILATEKAEAIVVMLGLNDRVALREAENDKSDGKATDGKTCDSKTTDNKSSDKKANKKDGADKKDARTKPADATK